MPNGSFDMGPLPTAMSSQAPLFQVCVYDSSSDDPSTAFTPLPNIACMRIDEREGPFPPVAVFEYLLDDNYAANYGWPSQVEQIWPIDAPPNPYVVENDDRLVVMTVDDSGNTSILFDGFAQIPQADIAGRAQQATFSAVAASWREWDEPIKGRFQRDADSPDSDPESGPTKTDLPCRFNPSDTAVADGNKGGMIANCTPDGQDVGESDDTTSHPVFLDPSIETQGGAKPPNTLWTISKACRYLMAVGNPDETYVNNPDFSVLTDLLQAYFPPSGSGTISPGGDQTADIVIRDYDASDKAWPDAVAELLGYAGFGCSFVTTSDDSGLPSTTLDIYRKDALTMIAPKQVYLQSAGGDVSSGQNNVASFHMVRDCKDIINHYSIESPLKQVEVSFILAPLYTPNQSDTTPGPSGRGQYLKSAWTATTTATIKRLYRWYGMDEIGLGHYDIDSSTWLTTAFDFSSVFPPDNNGNPLYVKRARPGSSSLSSVDQDGSPLKADLSISFDYDGAAPAIWDGATGHWFKVNGGWDLLDDRLGIRVTIEDPEQWGSGKKANDIRGISWWADPTTLPMNDPGGNPTNGYPPVLRLTTVIDDDRMLSAIADKRTASPTQFTRRRRADARDHFQYNRVLANSMYNTTAKDKIARDDTPLAQAHAYQLRLKTEFPPVSGSIKFPFVTDYYQLGDRIDKVVGRDINLQTNVGVGQGEAADYPFVVGRSRVLLPDLETTIQLSDHRASGVNL